MWEALGSIPDISRHACPFPHKAYMFSVSLTTIAITIFENSNTEYLNIQSNTEGEIEGYRGIVKPQRLLPEYCRPRFEP